MIGGSGVSLEVAVGRGLGVDVGSLFDVEAGASEVQALIHLHPAHGEGT